MPIKVEQVLIEFFKNQCAQGKKLGIALSGGPDSMALCHALWRIQRLLKTELIVLHYDHAWRKESSQEAQVLLKRMQLWGLPVVMERSSQSAPTRDRENHGRQARRAFFQRATREHALHAVILAQHADDQAETVLKRLFEGASLAALGAMRPVSQAGELQLWRPFLGLRRQDLLDYVSRHGLDAFSDPTNLDSSFLRGRLRTQILPRLAADFGKEPSRGLCELGRQAARISDYLDRRIQPLLEDCVWEQGCCRIPLQRLPKERLEAEQFLRRLSGGLPREILEQILSSTETAARRWQTRFLSVERRRGELVLQRR